MSNAGNQSCLMVAEDTVSFLVCGFHALEEWLGLGQLEDYLSVLEYLLWVFTPLAIVFILPFLIVILLYLSILFLHVYKRKNQLREAYCNNLWDGARKTLATLWDGHGAIWHGFFRWLYETFRLPIAPIYGGFPVKFRTFLGEPIPYDPNITALELAEKVKQAVQSLIDKHQQIPGNVLRALLERFRSKYKKE